jgi:hypothetical protein
MSECQAPGCRDVLEEVLGIISLRSLRSDKFDGAGSLVLRVCEEIDIEDVLCNSQCSTLTNFVCDRPCGGLIEDL